MKTGTGFATGFPKTSVLKGFFIIYFPLRGKINLCLSAQGQCLFPVLSGKQNGTGEPSPRKGHSALTYVAPEFVTKEYNIS